KEKNKKIPHWLTVDLSSTFRGEISAFYQNEEMIQHYLKEYVGMDAKLISRTAHIEVFPFDIRTLNPCTPQTVFLFNYKTKNINELANIVPISLPTIKFPTQ
ncbi:MAG: DUF4080 domain-containing protein, partial [Oscillospiraceae bacterium]